MRIMLSLFSESEAEGEADPRAESTDREFTGPQGDAPLPAPKGRLPRFTYMPRLHTFTSGTQMG